MSGELKVALGPCAHAPERMHATDAGADIRTPLPIDLGPWESATVHTGVRVQLPPGTVGTLKSRSGLNLNHDIISEGVIDEGYTGEILVRLHNLRGLPYHFDAGDRITQLVVLPVLYPEVVVVDAVEGGERGDAGHGSTGR
jgi:dUTP pyrophosphatase